MRPRQILLLGTFLFLFICALSVLRLSATHIPTTFPSNTESQPQAEHAPPDSAPKHDAPSPPPPQPVAGAGAGAGAGSPAQQPPPAEHKPMPVAKGSHPMWQLIKDSERELEIVKARQSTTLEAAVKEYRARYGIPPPPNFDKWFELAQSRDVQLIDEFDMIHEMMTPFWGLKPITIRKRAKEALGYEDNRLLGISVRHGNVTYVEGGREWMQEAIQGMMQPFLEYLPNMDLAFNTHDEPRVIVPHGDLSRLVARGHDNMAAAHKNPKPSNAWTKSPIGLSEGSRFQETKITRFNVFSHQQTWSSSRLSCAGDSPARQLEEDERQDNTTSYGLGELGFIYNITAMSDICLSPSLSGTYGFFDRPNSYSIVQDLFPIFSQSKISSYSDIMYPSPWYWYEKVEYNETQDFAWAEKEDRLYWRGSTTGGYSREGSWRRHHRQHFVQKINAADQAKILVNKGDEMKPDWRVKEVPRGDYKGIIDVFFSHIGQCDRGDCHAQHEFFTLKDRAEQHDAWKYKYLLDIDGNAFSGRFYAFLRSRSLVYKFALFREWHMEWLKPWVDYIPLSLQGDEWLEAVRFFGDGALGKKEAERIALQGRDWANKVLRREDMEVWLFRLLLEYGRVTDDNRENLGFSL